MAHHRPSQKRYVGLEWIGDNGYVTVSFSGERLVAIIYDELRALAQEYLRRERVSHTLQPTALVHEAYMRLVAADSIRFEDRDHFFAIAATTMRRVLVDHARQNMAGKRGGGWRQVAIEVGADDGGGDDGGDGGGPGQADLDVMVLDEVMRRLSAQHPRACRVVEFRIFGGLSTGDIARLVGVSRKTVTLDWSFAKAWLSRELSTPNLVRDTISGDVGGLFEVIGGRSDQGPPINADSSAG